MNTFPKLEKKKKSCSEVWFHQVMQAYKLDIVEPDLLAIFWAERALGVEGTD